MHNISFLKENNFVFVLFFILSLFHVLLNNLMSVLKKNPRKTIHIKQTEQTNIFKN